MKTRLLFVRSVGVGPLRLVGCGSDRFLSGRTEASPTGPWLDSPCAYAAALVLAACFIAAGCGGSSSAQEEPDASTSGPRRPSRTPRRSRRSGVLPARTSRSSPGTADFAPGPVRFTFLVVDGQGRVVTRPTAQGLARQGAEGDAVRARRPRRREPIGVNGNEPGRAAGGLRLAPRRSTKPGKYWVLAEPVGGRKIQAVGNVVVKPETDGAGRRRAAAFPSETPTLANATHRGADDVDAARSASSTASRSRTRSRPRSPSSSPSRRRSTARAARAARSSTSSAPSAGKHERLRRQLHPRRDLPGQRPDEGREHAG